MQNKILICVLGLLLVGCATTQPTIQTVIQKVEVPIAVKCNATIPDRPLFNFDNLNIEDDIFTQSRALLADRQLYIAYEGELLAALNSCVK